MFARHAGSAELRVQEMCPSQHRLDALHAVDALLAVKDLSRAHIVHDLLAAHAHVCARGSLAAFILHKEIERAVRRIWRHGTDLLAGEIRGDCGESLRQSLPDLPLRHRIACRRQINRVPCAQLVAKEHRQPRQRQHQEEQRADETHPPVDLITKTHCHIGHLP